ncbi:ATP pyrophosphatase [uncultured Rothia sp.]|uniref:ATP pyrophosphatase n=1 Tax=uncultured Rothia sp. TaxID=316088 RepID=UPI0028E66AE9|nr:ATP pyrophosphatase [uncultured Rothia sp.]
MVNTIMIFIWGALDSLLIYKVLRTVVTYELNRHREKKLRAEAVYVIRTNRFEIATYALVILPFALGVFIIHLWEDVGFHFAFDFIGLGMIGFFMFFFCDAAGTYVKISPEGIERGEPFNDTVFFPLKAIDTVSYDNNTDREYADSLHFYTKSGKLVAEFCPVFGSYPLLAMTRFRIENERWPDMSNPDDIAQIAAWANRRSTLRYFRYGEISGLAEVDM